MDVKNIHNICRICLENDATIPIFESTEINSVQFKLSSCINEKVTGTTTGTEFTKWLNI